MKPHLVRWHKELAEKGLVVVDIYDGRNDAFEAVKADAEKSELSFPVLWDARGRVCAEYGMKGYPGGFLVGVDGKVLWEGIPNPKVKEIEALIQEELAKVKPEK
jgi:hypothetical protein